MASHPIHPPCISPCERLALNAYLGQLDNPQVAFGVKQKAPQTLDAAIAATLELESYLPTKTTAVALVSDPQLEPEEPTTVTVGAVSRSAGYEQQLGLATIVEKLLDRVEKLEVGAPQPRWGRSRNRGNGITCWNCGKIGHVQRVCRAPKREEQGNP